MSRLLALSPDSDDYFDRVVQAVRSDVAMALQVMKLANSCYSKPVDPVQSLHQAVLRIGARYVVSIAVAATLSARARENGRSDAMVHSLEVASIAQALATRCRGFATRPEHAYLVGLVHDVGAFVTAAPSDEGSAVEHRAAWDTPDHALVSATVCRHWQLPDEVCEVVRLHHDTPPPHLRQHRSSALLLDLVQHADEWSTALALEPHLRLQSATGLGATLSELASTDRAEDRSEERRPPELDADQLGDLVVDALAHAEMLAMALQLPTRSPTT